MHTRVLTWFARRALNADVCLSTNAIMYRQLYCTVQYCNSSQKYIIPTVLKHKYKSWYRNLKMLTYQRWASKSKFLGSFLRCASPQIENPQISTKYCTTLSHNSPKSLLLLNDFLLRVRTHLNKSMICHICEEIKYAFVD